MVGCPYALSLYDSDIWYVSASFPYDGWYFMRTPKPPRARARGRDRAGMRARARGWGRSGGAVERVVRTNADPHRETRIETLVRS